jgi:hypothetical protein
MSKMAELSMQIEELVEQGMTAKFISATLNVPIEWVYYAIEERNQLELQKQNEFINYGEE